MMKTLCGIAVGLSVALGSAATGAWNDVAGGERVFRFMVEFEPQAVPEPSIIALLAAGFLALVVGARVRRRKRPAAGS